MKYITFFNKIRNAGLLAVAALLSALVIISCDPTIDGLSYDLPEANSKPDETPPTANFSASVTDNYLAWNFGNASTNATTYAWDFGDGNTSTSVDASNTYADEGTYTVSLTASDALGQSDTYTTEIIVVQPEVPDVPDPSLVNADFDKQPKSSGSDCACAGWINRSIGDQGESSSGNGGSDNVLKFDNNEPDIIYQEFEVVPNADYTMTVVTSFKDPLGGSFPSELEIRLLEGAGYTTGYTPTYYMNAVDMPQDNWGYTSVSQVEEAGNNILVETLSNPGSTSYMSQTIPFNVGANSSVALYIRGIGGPATGGAGGDFGFNSGDEEIRIDSVVIEAVN